jgi:uncharacterized membrane-anchored protein YhcB (DUF1043 family)
MGYVIIAFVLGYTVGWVMQFIESRRENDAIQVRLRELERTNERYKNHILQQFKFEASQRDIDIDPDE